MSLTRKLKALEKSLEIPSAGAQVLPSMLDDMVVEEKSFAEDDDKVYYTFDESLSSLRERGYERHLRPDEAFSLMIDALKNASSKFKVLAEDMSSGGEWLSLAMKREGTCLLCYVDPDIFTQTPVHRKSKLYEPRSTLVPSRVFSVKGLPSNRLLDLEALPEDLVVFLYGRNCRDLPGDIQSAQVSLPERGIVVPYGRGDYNAFYDVVPLNSDGGYSRGMRLRSS
ncbi:MAG: hypothetical protein Q7R96_03110 [Nanoarchaeota archaeon]|nr:hypothetical protein [Nanoarchaeota archaeon]